MYWWMPALRYDARPASSCALRATCGMERIIADFEWHFEPQRGRSSQLRWLWRKRVSNSSAFSPPLDIGEIITGVQIVIVLAITVCIYSENKIVSCVVSPISAGQGQPLPVCIDNCAECSIGTKNPYILSEYLVSAFVVEQTRRAGPCRINVQVTEPPLSTSKNGEYKQQPGHNDGKRPFHC